MDADRSHLERISTNKYICLTDSTRIDEIGVHTYTYTHTHTHPPPPPPTDTRSQSQYRFGHMPGSQEKKRTPLGSRAAAQAVPGR